MRSSTRPAVGDGHRVDDATVGEEQHAVGVGGGDRVVGDHHDGLGEAVDGVAHEAEDLGAGAAVEVAGRLVGEDQLGLVGERAGDGDALLLAAGQFARSVLEPVGQPDGVDHVAQPLLVGLLAGEVHRQGDVLDRGQHRQQVERLEDEPDALAAQSGELGVGQRARARRRRRTPCRSSACRARRGSA